MKKIVVALLSAVTFSSSFANVDKGLAYKSSGLSADDVAAQNYFVNISLHSITMELARAVMILLP